MRFEIVAEASAGLLCRIIGLFAQHDTVAPDMTVEVSGETMVIAIGLDDMPDGQCAIVAQKIARCIGVETVELN